MSLSTTIVRSSPTPPLEPGVLDQVPPQHSKSLDPLPGHQAKSPEPSSRASALSCTRSQSACTYQEGPGELSAGGRTHQRLSESDVRQLTKVDSGYCSNVNLQQAAQSSQQWGGASSVSSAVFGPGLAVPPSYPSEGLHYVPIPSFKAQCAPGLMDLPHPTDMQSLLTGRPLFNPQLTQQYLGAHAPIHPGAYHVGGTGNGVLGVSSTGMSVLLSSIKAQLNL